MASNNGIHFEISERKVLLRVLDVLFVLLAVYILSLFFKFDYLSLSSEFFIPIIVLVLYITTFGTIFELYDLEQASKLDTTFKNIVLTSSVTVLLYLLTPFYTPFLPENRLQIIYFYLAIVAAIFIWRLVYVMLIQSPRFYKRVLIIGETSNLNQIVTTLKIKDPNYRIVGFVNAEEQKANFKNENNLKEFYSDELADRIRSEKVSEVMVASLNPENMSSSLYHELILLLEKGFSIREYTQVYEELTYRVPITYVGKDFYRYFPFSRSNQNRLYLFYHRLFDIIFSLLGIMMGFIVLPVILLGNLLGNRGPLFYTQERVGRHGKLFRILKLRSMVRNAELNGAQWATKDDDRVTPFGMFLRRSRLDEIPQFLNILKGEMSLIGPRPERPSFVKELSQILPFYETRHIIKPGLTGWAQVKSRYGSSIEDSLEKLEFDLYYIKHRSIFLDLNIVIKTISSVLYYRGQ